VRTERAAGLAEPATRFALPAHSEAGEPPERRGTPRDAVRLLVAGSEGVAHHRFRDLPELLDPGDLVVVNTSATVAAALDARHDDGRPAPVHVSAPLDDGRWVVEPRRRDGRGPDLDARPGAQLRLPDGRRLDLEEPYPDPGALPSRLWTARVTPPVAALDYLARHGHPIGYGHLAARFPLADHQTVYATEPGSAEMPSAGRPFTAPLVVRLVARGIVVAPVVLHAAVSSPELHEPPLPERAVVPAPTARLVNDTRAAGGRIVAVGTTVVRALESASDERGAVRPLAGWTGLVLGPDRPARVVDALITGLHSPEASHLLLLEAVAGPATVGAAYAAAVREGYLWHEFGDSMLFL
jgi:S-adenosylmethionine:tRNA ribosyltransferase-isomerase